MSSAQMSLRDQEQVVSRLRVVLQTISGHEQIYPITLSIFLFLRDSYPEKYALAMKGDLTTKDFLSFIADLPNEREALKAFSELRKGSGSSFCKELMEGVFLAGLNELLGHDNPELEEYMKVLNSIDIQNNRSQYAKLQHTLRIATEVSVGLKDTEKRLNLTSNFVQN
jgi:hypothetical protein